MLKLVWKINSISLGNENSIYFGTNKNLLVIHNKQFKVIDTLKYRNENNSRLKDSYLQNETRYNLNENNSLIYKTRENKEKSFTEFYNIMYQYQNDCLTAGIEYNKEYYNERDLKPSENLFFKISIIPFGGFNTPNLKWLN